MRPYRRVVLVGILRDNPILWREGTPKFLRRASPRARLALLAGLGIVSIGAALALYWTVSGWEGSGPLAVGLAWVWAGAAVLLVPARTARAIVRERQQGTWDAVILTRLRPSEIVWGKLLAAVTDFWALGLFLLPICLALDWKDVAAGSLIVALGDPPPLLLIALAYGTATIGALTAASFGLYVSMRTSSGGSALLWTYLLLWLGGQITMLAGLIMLFVLPLRFVRMDRYHRTT